MLSKRACLRREPEETDDVGWYRRAPSSDSHSSASFLPRNSVCRGSAARWSNRALPSRTSASFADRRSKFALGTCVKTVVFKGPPLGSGG